MKPPVLTAKQREAGMVKELEKEDFYKKKPVKAVVKITKIEKPSPKNDKELSYDQWKNRYNLKETPDYNLKRAWELGYNPDKTGHLPTVDNQTGQFLKAKGHPTLKKELDWYNSPAGADFKSKNSIDSSGKFFKYVPKSQALTAKEREKGMIEELEKEDFYGDKKKQERLNKMAKEAILEMETKKAVERFKKSPIMRYKK